MFTIMNYKSTWFSIELLPNETSTEGFIEENTFKSDQQSTLAVTYLPGHRYQDTILHCHVACY